LAAQLCGIQPVSFERERQKIENMTATVVWSSPIATPELTNSEIHVWRVLLPTDQVAVRRLEATLASDEQARAARFIFERDQARFIAARGILRDSLGKYMRCAPQAVEFVYGPRGKPAVAGRSPLPALRFNLSHSNDLAVIAIARAREVGIDIEMIRPGIATDEIAKRYFSSKETAELSRMPAELRTEAFFLCWTRKEAYIKARGDGLHIPLDSFDVSLSPTMPATLSSADESRWSIESFVPSLATEPKYAGAVAAEGKDWTARYFDWK
jgi:4'-phosphopantetheinyl transferase